MAKNTTLSLDEEEGKMYNVICEHYRETRLPKGVPLYQRTVVHFMIEDVYGSIMRKQKAKKRKRAAESEKEEV